MRHPGPQYAVSSRWRPACLLEAACRLAKEAPISMSTRSPVEGGKDGLLAAISRSRYRTGHGVQTGSMKALP
jgi:hypothetical protein